MIERAMQSVSGQNAGASQYDGVGSPRPVRSSFEVPHRRVRGCSQKVRGRTQRRSLALTSARRCCGGGRRLEDHFGKLTSLWEGLWEVDVAVGGMTHIWEVAGQSGALIFGDAKSV